MNTPLRRPVLHKTTSSFSYLPDGHDGPHPPFSSHTGTGGWRQPDRSGRKWLVIIDYGPELVASTNEIKGVSEGGSLLAPLQSTAHQQVVHILPQLLLPTPLGLSFQLSLPGSGANGPLPKITDAVWGQLFSSFLSAQGADMVPREDFGGLPIAARLVLKVDLRQARWYEAWRRDPTEGTVAKWLDVREVARSLGHDVNEDRSSTVVRHMQVEVAPQAAAPRPPPRLPRQALPVPPPLQPLSYSTPIGKRRSPRPSPLDLSALTRSHSPDSTDSVSAREEHKEVGVGVPSPLESCTTFGKGSLSVPLSISTPSPSPIASSIHEHYPYGGPSISPDPRLPPVYPLAHPPRPPVSPPYSIVSSTGPPSVRRVPHDPRGPADWIPTPVVTEGFDHEVDTVLPLSWCNTRVFQPEEDEEDDAFRHWPYGLDTPVKEWAWKGHEVPSPILGAASSNTSTSPTDVEVLASPVDRAIPVSETVEGHDVTRHEPLNLPVNLDPHPWENDWPYLQVPEDAASARPITHEEQHMPPTSPPSSDKTEHSDSHANNIAVFTDAAAAEAPERPESPSADTRAEVATIEPVSAQMDQDAETLVELRRRPRPSAIFPVRESPRAYDSPPPFSDYVASPPTPEPIETIVSPPSMMTAARRAPSGPRAASSYTPQISANPMAETVRRAQSQSRPIRPRPEQAPPSSFTDSQESSARLYSVPESARQSTLSVTSTTTSSSAPKRPLKRLSQTLAGFSEGGVGSETPLNCPRADQNEKMSSTTSSLSADAYPNLVIYPRKVVPSFLYPDIVIYPKLYQPDVASALPATEVLPPSNLSEALAPAPAPTPAVRPKEIEILSDISKYPQLLLYPPIASLGSTSLSLPGPATVHVTLTTYSYPDIILYPNTQTAVQPPVSIGVMLTKFDYPDLVIYPSVKKETQLPTPVGVTLTRFDYPNILLYPPVQVLLQPISYPSLEIYPKRPIEIPILLTDYRYPHLVLYPQAPHTPGRTASVPSSLEQTVGEIPLESADGGSLRQAQELQPDEAVPPVLDSASYSIADPVLQREQSKSPALSENMVSPARSFAALKANLARLETISTDHIRRHTHSRDTSDTTTTSGSRTPGSALPTPRTMSPDSNELVGLADSMSPPLPKSTAASARVHLPHMARTPPAYAVSGALEQPRLPASDVGSHGEAATQPAIGSHRSPRARSSTLIADRMKSLFDLQQSPPPPAPSARYARSGTLSGGQNPMTSQPSRGPLPPAPSTSDDQKRPVGRLSSAMMKNWV